MPKTNKRVQFIHSNFGNHPKYSPATVLAVLQKFDECELLDAQDLKIVKEYFKIYKEQLQKGCS